MNQGWQSESTDGPKGAWDLLSFSLFLWLSTHLPAYLLCIYLSIYLSLSLSSNYLSIHNGVHFFDISTSKSGPNLVCFVHFDLEMCFAPQRRAIFYLSSGQLAPHPPLSEPTFRLSGATNHWENTVFRDFPTFSRICLLTLSLLLFSLLIFLFSLPLPYSAFHLSILSGGLTSKLPLPSIMVIPFNTFMAPIASP